MTSVPEPLIATELDTLFVVVTSLRNNVARVPVTVVAAGSGTPRTSVASVIFVAPEYAREKSVRPALPSVNVEALPVPVMSRPPVPMKCVCPVVAPMLYPPMFSLMSLPLDASTSSMPFCPL